MTSHPGLLLTVFAFLAVIGPLVFVHELGHYLVGRWFGVKADAFSIGFGREIFGFTDRLGTRWKFGWLPLGGYVRFAGDMNPASQPDPDWMLLPAEERNRTFQAKPVWQRALIVVAGPVTNLVLAVLVLSAFSWVQGEGTNQPIAGAVIAGTPADAAGFQAGDRLKSVDGHSITTFADVSRYVRAHPDQRMTMVVTRGGEELALAVTAKSAAAVDENGHETKIGLLGISGQTRAIGPVKALKNGVEQCRIIVVMMATGLRQIVLGERSAKELGGPLRIAQISGEAANAGPSAFAFFVALISINLGFINLLPVPMLDGGHLLFYALEAVRRKPVEPRVQVGSSRVDLQACKLEYSIVSPK